MIEPHEPEATALAPLERPSLALRAAPLAPTACPVALYLGRLQTAPGRASQASALRALARVVAGVDDPRLVPWEALPYGYFRLLATALTERFAPATVERLWAALRGTLEEAANLDLLAEEALARMRRVKLRLPEVEPKGRALTDAEWQALWDNADPQDRTVLALGALAGLRRAEIVALDVADFTEDAEGAQVRVRRGKGRKERVVPLGPRGRAAVGGWIRASRPGRETPGPLLPGVKGWRLGASTVSARLAALAERAGVPHVAPHDLRRTYVTRLLAKGNDLSTVAGLAGHKNLNTTRKYDRRGDDAKRAAADTLD